MTLHQKNLLSSTLCVTSSTSSPDPPILASVRYPTHYFLILCRDVTTLQAGMGDKVATFIQWVSTFVMGAIICLSIGWELTLVILSVAPIAAAIGAVVARVSCLCCYVRTHVAAVLLSPILLYMYSR